MLTSTKQKKSDEAMAIKKQIKKNFNFVCMLVVLYKILPIIDVCAGAPPDEVTALSCPTYHHSNGARFFSADDQSLVP